MHRSRAAAANGRLSQFRHITIKTEAAAEEGRRWITRRSGDAGPDTRSLPAVYFLYILGSGGHTTEMLETVKRKWRPQVNQHRRYLVTTGDEDSLRRLVRLECLIRDAVSRDERSGTVDTFAVPRARRVHQPLLTAPFTCLATAIYAVNALTREPNARPLTRHGRQFKFPHVVVTNGPATGFVVCLVAHLLKIFFLVPENRLRLVYLESWARTRTLSLTGKLFRWSGIADLFCVQHEELARRTGAVFVGEITSKAVQAGEPPAG